MRTVHPQKANFTGEFWDVFGTKRVNLLNGVTKHCKGLQKFKANGLFAGIMLKEMVRSGFPFKK